MMGTQLVGTRSAATAARGRGYLAELAERVVGWWRERRRIARTIAELEALSDSELADIGISRADIERVARGSVHHGA
ncbi:MAG: DUF1127 domain-containing protein [Geminicoccaceae bacterium]|nr:DUF1127 domain-containing protein [Geminicoccaceae bacterium]